MTDILKLVIVDDEPLARHRIRSFNLRENGYEIIGEAENGYEAIELINRLKPDIVVTDIEMPVMDGLHMMEEISKFHNPPKIILLTCHEDFQKVQTALRLGAQDYLVKVMLREDNFIQSLTKIAQAIFKERQAYRKLIRKNLSDLVLGKGWDNNECVEQLSELGINPRLFCFMLLEVDPQLQQSIPAYKFSFEKWEGLYRTIVVNITSRKWVIFLYTLESDDRKAFGYWVHSFCKERMDNFSEVNSELSRNFWIAIGSICWDIGKITAASKQIATLSEKLFYERGASIITSDSNEVIKFGSMPQEEFQKTVDKFRNACVSSEGEQAADCIISWAEAIEKDYRPCTREVKTMGTFLAACIPLYIAIYHEGSMSYSLGQWLKAQFESSAHMSDIRSAVKIAAERLALSFVSEEGTMRIEIKKALEFIRENYYREIDLSAAANYVNLSPSWFGTLFRTEVNQTFSEYLASYRIKMAQYLLSNTDMQIGKVGESVGIEDSHYFSRLFNKITGKSPSEYRNNCRNKKISD